MLEILDQISPDVGHETNQPGTRHDRLIAAMAMALTTPGTCLLFLRTLRLLQVLLRQLILRQLLLQQLLLRQFLLRLRGQDLMTPAVLRQFLLRLRQVKLMTMIQSASTLRPTEMQARAKLPARRKCT